MRKEPHRLQTLTLMDCEYVMDMKKGPTGPVRTPTLYIFDMMAFNSQPLLHMSLEERLKYAQNEVCLIELRLEN